MKSLYDNMVIHCEKSVSIANLLLFTYTKIHIKQSPVETGNSPMNSDVVMAGQGLTTK